MAFLLKKPFIIIIIVIIAAVVVISFSGILSIKPAGLTISSADFVKRKSIKMGENTTLVVVLENKAPQSKTFELHIIYTSENLKFYDNITGNPLPDPDSNPPYYNITHPTKGTLDTQGRVEIPILVKGLEPMGTSQTYTISLEVFSLNGYKKTLADTKSVQLTVTRS